MSKIIEQMTDKEHKQCMLEHGKVSYPPVTREKERITAAERAYPYRGDTKGYICETSIPIFIQGAKWADESMVAKACEYLRNHIDKDLTIYHNDTWLNRDEFIERFKKAMEK